MADGANDPVEDDEPPGVQPVMPGVQLERPVPEEIEVEGKRLTAETPAAELKLARRALGIGATGSKTVLFKRLVKHMWRRKMEDHLAYQSEIDVQQQFLMNRRAGQALLDPYSVSFVMSFVRRRSRTERCSPR